MDSDSGHDAPILIDAAEDDLPRLQDLDQLTEFILGHDQIYLRYSEGPWADRRSGPSRDFEAGVDLPGLSVTTVVPENWWPRPASRVGGAQAVQVRRGRRAGRTLSMAVDRYGRRARARPRADPRTGQAAGTDRRNRGRRGESGVCREVRCRPGFDRLTPRTGPGADARSSPGENVNCTCTVQMFLHSHNGIRRIRILLAQFVIHPHEIWRVRLSAPTGCCNLQLPVDGEAEPWPWPAVAHPAR